MSRAIHDIDANISDITSHVDPEAWLTSHNHGVHMAAGAIAGVMEHTIMYPFDVVKVSATLTAVRP